MQAACVVTCGVVVWMWCGAAASRTDGAVPVQACRCTRAERTEHLAVAATAPPASGQAPQSPSPLSSRARSPSPIARRRRIRGRHHASPESGTGGRPCVNSYQDGARFVWTHRGNPKVCMFVRSMVNAVRRPPSRHGGAQLKRGAQRGGEGGPRSRACRTAGCSGGCRRSGAGPSTPAPRQTCKSRPAPPCLSRVTLLVPNQPCGSRLTVVCRPPPSK